MSSVTVITHYTCGATHIIKPTQDFKGLGNEEDLRNLARDIAGNHGIHRIEIQRHGNKKGSPKKKR